MHAYDILMLIVLVLCTIFGAWKGVAWQLAALASLVVSWLVAVRYGGPLAPFVSVEEPWNRYVAMLLLYLATSLVIWLLFRLVAGIIDRVHLREFDRQVGALFGAAKGVLWCLVITFFAVTLSESAREAVLQARSGHYIAVLIHRAEPLLPQEIRDVLGRYIDQLHWKLHPDEAPSPPAGDGQEGTPERTEVSTGDSAHPGSGGAGGRAVLPSRPPPVDHRPTPITPNHGP